MARPIRLAASVAAFVSTAVALCLACAGSSRAETLYFTDTQFGGVLRMAVPGGTVTPIASGQPLVQLFGVAVDSLGNIFTVSWAWNRVIRIDGQTGQAIVLASGGPIDNPDGIAIGPGGQLYVTQVKGPALVRIDGTTGYIRERINSGPIVGCVGITFGPDGILYATHAHRAQIVRFDPITGAQTVLHSGPPLITPLGIGYAPDGTLRVADINARALFRFSTAGEYLSTIASGGILATIQPGMLAVAPTGETYISNYYNNDGGRGVAVDVSGQQSPLNFGVSHAAGLAFETPPFSEDIPVSTQLRNFEAIRVEEGVRIRIELAAPAEGWIGRVWRGTDEAFDHASQLQALPAIGMELTYLDGTAAPSESYYYWFELVSDGEMIQRIGPVAVPASMDVPLLSFVRSMTANPTNGDSHLEFAVGRDVSPPGGVQATMTLHSVDGRLVKTLERSTMGPGRYVRVWKGDSDSGDRVPSGVYYLRLRLGTWSRTLKLIRT